MQIVNNSKILQKFANVVPILIILLILIITPRPIAGYLELNKARKMEEAGHYLSAAHAYAIAAERLEWAPSLWEEAGLAAEMGGDPTEVIVLLNKAVARNVISQFGWLSLGEAYHATGDLPSAMKAWKRALPLAQAAHDMAVAQRQMGDFQAAIQSWRTSLIQDPWNASAHYQLGLLLMETAPNEALPELMQAAQLDPKLDASVQNLRDTLNTALLSEDRAYQFLIAGRALGSLGEWDLAAEAFRNAIALKPDYSEAWGWLSEARQRQGQDGSIEMERALALHPDSAMLQSLYGIYLQRQKQPARALAAFQKAAALEPQEPGWQMALGGAYEQTGDLVAALEHYQRAVALSPSEPAGWRALAEFSLRNSVDLAGIGLPAARKLLDLAYNDWQSQDIIGQVTMETNDLIGAESYLRKAVELGPTQAAPYLHLGLLYLQTRKPGLAYSNFLQVQALDPEGPFGWQASRLLKQYFP